uniref:Uncharacterized protein n=1 Tax=Rhizophagus irregularis (strain DAOM 181602 / DAOM 197198 / MUCL 43194) TaxID=747089 RepID=U9UVY1_RHIID
MADVFFALIQMAISIKALPTETSEELKEFRQKCIQFYNYRWKQFDFERMKQKKYLIWLDCIHFIYQIAQQELNYAGKNLSEDAFNQIMQDYAKSLTLDSDMFEINLIPEEEEENNDQLNEDDSNLLVGNLIKLNNVNREDIELEEVDHGDLEFSVDDILANVNRLNSKI